MARSPSHEAIENARTFLHELWFGLRPQTDETLASLRRVGQDEQILQVAVAQDLFPKWEGLSEQLIVDPKKLNLSEANILRAERVLDLPPLERAELPTVLPVKYSTVTVLADRISPQSRLPRDPRQAAPQVRVALTEMFTNAQREVRRTLQGISESQETDIRHTDALSEAETALLGVLAKEFVLIGKATWFRPDEHKVWTWDLSRITVGVAVSGMTVAHSEVRFGKEDTEVARYLHPISFDHDALDAGIQGLLGDAENPGAIETLMQLVKKKLSS